LNLKHLGSLLRRLAGTNTAAPDTGGLARHELFAVVAHELRSPIGAILGFEELLSEGIFGDVPAAGADALVRIRRSAHQLLDLVAGLSDLSGGDDEPAPTGRTTDLPALLAAVLDDVRQDASSRGTSLQLIDKSGLSEIVTDTARMQRALRLALMAAIKTAGGDPISLVAACGDQYLQLEVSGHRLLAARDEPAASLQDASQPRLSGAGLRIAMARAALAPLGGQVTLHEAPGGARLRLLVPTRARD